MRALWMATLVVAGCGGVPGLCAPQDGGEPAEGTAVVTYVADGGAVTKTITGPMTCTAIDDWTISCVVHPVLSQPIESEVDIVLPPRGIGVAQIGLTYAGIFQSVAVTVGPGGAYVMPVPPGLRLTATAERQPSSTRNLYLSGTICSTVRTEPATVAFNALPLTLPPGM